MKIILFVFFILKYFYKIKCQEIEDELEKACTNILIPTPDNCMVASLNKKKKCCYFFDKSNDDEYCKYIEIKNVKKKAKDENVKIDCSSNFIQNNLIIIFISFLFF